MTYDDLIAGNAWTEDLLVVRGRAANFIVDGVRLGGIDLETRSGSPHDAFMLKRHSEILSAADLLSRLGETAVEIFTKDASGKDLESPDVDCVIANGERFGIEVGEVVSTDDARHQSELNKLEKTLSDLVDTDPTFSAALGNFDLTINLNKIGVAVAAPLGKKPEIAALTDEIQVFIRVRDHLVPTRNYYSRFSDTYPVLHAREAEFNATSFTHGYITVGDGPLPVVKTSQIAEVVRVLDGHRVQAAKYRDIPAWIVMPITGDWEIFNDTISAVKNAKLPIDPFVRAFVTDDTGRILEIGPILVSGKN